MKGVSFHVSPKQTVAFVGSTGSGKTTILSLICRNYDIQKGQILIDGIDIKKIKISSLRKHFGQMLQDVFLFSGDIRSNILLRQDGVTDEEVLEACRYVNADSFINKLEGGINEAVRERGNNFSAGQRQLLSFTRTIIHKPSVMILDEATANIDILHLGAKCINSNLEVFCLRCCYLLPCQRTSLNSGPVSVLAGPLVTEQSS